MKIKIAVPSKGRISEPSINILEKSGPIILDLKTNLFDFFRGAAYLRPKVKDTFPKEKKEKWVCGICQYEYDGEIPFEELPDDWVCPRCGVGKELFEKI